MGLPPEFAHDQLYNNISLIKEKFLKERLNTTKGYRILIVGGGLGGLTLATALSQKGLKAELVERNTDWRADGAGIAMQPNGLRILGSLGLAEDVERMGAVIHYWDFCDQDGQVLCESNLDEVWNLPRPFIGIERKKLQRILVAGAAAVTSRLGVTIRSLSRDQEGVSVSFTDGSSGRYDLVVGADGVSSIVRKMAFNTDPQAYAGHMSWRSVVPIRPSSLEKLQFHLGEGCFFGLCPVGGGGTYGFGSAFLPRFHEEMAGRLDKLRQRFSGFGNTVREYLDALDSDEQIHAAPVEWVEQEEWSTRSVILIGDAAHASSPMMGQGGCVAMEDAYVLAEVLQSEKRIEDALEVFVRRRKFRVQWVHEQSQKVASSIVLPAAIRNAALRELGEVMFLERFQPLVSEA